MKSGVISKVLRHRRRRRPPAAVTIVTLALVAVLFFSEIIWYRTTRIEEHLMVDTTQGDRDIDVRLDVVFHALKCSAADFRVEDSKGIAYDDLRVHLNKVPVNEDGSPAHGSEDAPGCRIVGTMSIKRVTGNFHVAAPRLMPFGMPFGFSNSAPEIASFNASHTISHLSFGPVFPNMVSPLDGHVCPHTELVAMYQYHVKVVPTVYETLGGRVMDTNQFSASDFTQELTPDAGQAYPGVWFRYDFSPIMVRLVETRHSAWEFLVSVCALIGGAFALSGIVDQVLHRSLAVRKEK